MRESVESVESATCATCDLGASELRENVGVVKDGSRLWLGTVAFGRWGNADHDECVRIIRRAMDVGITGIDTASSYADGEAEEIVGMAAQGRREHAFIVTKYGYDNTTAGSSTLTRAAIERSLERSLQRLRTDHVDVFLLHRLPASADHFELTASLDALVRSGKARAVGTSMASQGDLRNMNEIARRHGQVPVAWEQPPHSIFVRHIEAGILRTCVDIGVKTSTFAPFNGGWLTGKYRLGTEPPRDSRVATWPIRRDRFDFDRPQVVRKLEAVDALGAIAAASGRSLEQLALDFSLSRPDITSVVVGARTVEQLEALVRFRHRPLEPDVLSAIDIVVPPASTVDHEDIAGYEL